MKVIDKSGLRRASWVALLLATTLTLVAGCGIFPPPNQPPTCLLTSVPTDCEEPEGQR